MTPTAPVRARDVQDEALAELRRCAGTQFDPWVVEVFAAVLKDGTGITLRVA